MRRIPILGLIVFIQIFSFQACRADDRPNFVFLISEDNSKHYLKLFDEHGAETPNIRRLASTGLIFHRAFSNAPVCSVARTTLMTGCYAPRIGTQFHRRLKLVPLPNGTRMFPALLRAAGYYTTNQTKKDYNCIEGDGVWDASSRKASWQNRKPNQPFFHMQTFAQSHEGSLHFKQRRINENNVKTSIESVQVAACHPDNKTFRFTNAVYHDRIKIIDEQIGKVLSRLEKDGLMDDTIIFYFGDHGGVLPGSKGYLYETGLHIPLVVRVPKKFQHLCGFKLMNGKQVNGFVNFIDFGPTLLHLAGVEVPAEMDGKPFIGSSITSESLDSRQISIGYADRFDEKYDLVRSVRMGKYKYIRNYQPFQPDGLQNNYRYKMIAYKNWRQLFLADKLGPVQASFFKPKPPEVLFDLGADPWETNNLAEQTSQLPQLKKMRTALSREIKSWPDLGFYPEHFLIQHAFSNPKAFGQSHANEIANLIDIADLMLMEFDEAKIKIVSALESSNPWQRYWALTVCSAFGQQAKPMTDRIREMAANDAELLNRMRAAEFLAITRGAEKAFIGNVYSDILQKSQSRAEQAIVLNSVVLLRDSYDVGIDVKRSWFNKGNRKDNVERRLSYLRAK